MTTLKENLEKAWDDGFFYHLRNGNFIESEYEQLKRQFDGLSMENIDFSDKRLISLLWIIPLFINWQKERLKKNEVPESIISEISDFFYNQCEKILGLP